MFTSCTIYFDGSVHVSFGLELLGYQLAVHLLGSLVEVKKTVHPV